MRAKLPRVFLAKAPSGESKEMLRVLAASFSGRVR